MYVCVYGGVGKGGGTCDDVLCGLRIALSVWMREWKREQERDRRTDKSGTGEALQFQGDLDNFIVRIRGENEEAASNSIIILIYDLSLCPKVTDDFVTLDTFLPSPALLSVNIN